MTTFKKGDRVRIKATVDKKKYKYLWDRNKDSRLGKEGVISGEFEVPDGIGHVMEIGAYLWFKEDLEPIGLQPYDAVKVDAITGRIVYDAAVAAGKAPLWSYKNSAIMFWSDQNRLDGYVAETNRQNLNYLSLGEFIERLLVKTEEPLKYKDWTVEIKPGSVTIGCTTVDNATVKKIIAGMGGTKKHSLQDGDCVAIKDKALREWVACETTARSGVKPYDPTSTVNFPVFVYRKHHPAFVGNDNTNDRNELTIDQWLERCGGEVITTKQGNVQFNNDSITIGEYELPNELVKKIGEKLID